MANQCFCVQAARKEEIAEPPSTFKGDAILIGSNDGHGSEGYNPSLGLYTGQEYLNFDSLWSSWCVTQGIHQRL